MRGVSGSRYRLAQSFVHIYTPPSGFPFTATEPKKFVLAAETDSSLGPERISLTSAFAPSDIMALSCLTLSPINPFVSGALAASRREAVLSSVSPILCRSIWDEQDVV